MIRISRYDLPRYLDPEAGLMRRANEFYNYFHEICPQMEFMGRPVIAIDHHQAESTDGPLDLAYKLRGADYVLLDMLVDEVYYHHLMNHITENIINRIKHYKKLRWERFLNSPGAGSMRGKIWCHLRRY